MKSDSSKEKRSRAQTPVRLRAALVDAMVASLARRIECDYKLPAESVRLTLPSRRKAYDDGRIESLLKVWARI